MKGDRTLTVLEAHAAANCPDRATCWAKDIHDRYDPASGAATLREAASRMRRWAGAAEHFTSPWGIYPAGDGTCLIGYTTDNPDAGLVATTADYVPLEAAEHIASWHPSVALAVADWLDETARWWDTTTSHAQRPDYAALAVARAYLGPS